MKGLVPQLLIVPKQWQGSGDSKTIATEDQVMICIAIVFVEWQTDHLKLEE